MDLYSAAHLGLRIVGKEQELYIWDVRSGTKRDGKMLGGNGSGAIPKPFPLSFVWI